MKDAPFALNDVVEVDVGDLCARARVREASGGRLHLALEAGAYLPWVDEIVYVRHVGVAPERALVARIVHAGTSTALLQLSQINGASAGDSSEVVYVAGGAREPSAPIVPVAPIHGERDEEEDYFHAPFAPPPRGFAGARPPLSETPRVLPGLLAPSPPAPRGARVAKDEETSDFAVPASRARHASAEYARLVVPRSDVASGDEG